MTVDCENAGLKKIPETIPKQVYRLLLAKNDLRWIEPAIFDFSGFQNLEVIDFSKNSKLSYIDELTFSTNSKLKEVNLDNTGIKNFVGFYAPGLKILSLNTDSLEVFNMDMFVEKIIAANYSISGIKSNSIYSF